MTKKNKKNQDQFLKILIILLLLLTISLIIASIYARNLIEPDSKMAKNLHNMLNTEELTNCDGLFYYSDSKETYDTISSETKLCLAYQKSKIKNVETEFWKKAKKKDICTKDNMTFRVDNKENKCIVSKIDKAIIEKTYKAIFGKNINDDKSFKIDNSNICYLKDKYYYCGLSESVTYTLGNEAMIYRIIDKGVEKGKQIVLYDYFLKINNDICFKNYTTSDKNESCTKDYKNNKNIDYKFLKSYGTKYKHIFEKSSDDSYYWVSSEPVK